MTDWMTRRHPRTARYKGLLFASVLAIFIGLAYSGWSNVPPPQRVPAGVALLSTQIPLWVFATIWMAAGVVGVLSVMLFPERDGAVNPRRGAFVFAALFGLYLMWALGYLVAWGIGIDGRAWFPAGLYGCVAGMVVYMTRVFPPMWRPLRWRWRLWWARWR